jgi:hypothetical protein
MDVNVPFKRGDMTTNSPETVLSHNDHAGRYVTTKRRGVKTLAIVSGIALLLLTATYWPRGSSDAALAAPTPISDEPGTLVTPFRYFPSQFKNNAQSGPAEEHIQAY